MMPPPTSREKLDLTLAELAVHKGEWATLATSDRCALIVRLRADVGRVAERWEAAAVRAKGITPGTPTEAEEWLGGPYLVLRDLRFLERALSDIARRGRPNLPGRVTTLPSGQVAVRVFPADAYDRVFFRGFSGDVWMEPGVTAEALPQTQALAYREPAPGGKVALVLASTRPWTRSTSRAPTGPTTRSSSGPARRGPGARPSAVRGSRSASPANSAT